MLFDIVKSKQTNKKKIKIRLGIILLNWKKYSEKKANGTDEMSAARKWVNATMNV